MSPFTISYQTLALEKRVPLTISSGTTTCSRILWLRLAAGEYEGWGEAAEFSVDGLRQPLEELQKGMAAAEAILRRYDPTDRLGIEAALVEEQISSAVRSAVDQAWWDWSGRSSNSPVWRLWNVNPHPGPLTSVTIGISSPDQAQHRARQWLEQLDIGAFKIKLGSPAGVAADRDMFSAVMEVLPPSAKLSVDANGGWSAEVAIAMNRWLAARGVDHIEQPLSRDLSHQLPRLRRESPLPVILDESVFTSADIDRLAGGGCLDGINIKLMKCGGLSEALRMVETARARGLRILVGCYGNTALANTAAATLGPLVDYLDLDSHFNLKSDPFSGAALKNGRFVLPEQPGFGVSHAEPPGK